jgi:uncharacterized protein
MDTERRYLATADLGEDTIRLETRADGRPQIVGVSPPWNRWSVDLGGFKERFLPGAFSKWLDRSPKDPRGQADVVAKFNHDDNRILGRTINGTLTLEETERGLVYRATPPVGTPTTAEVLPLIEQRYVVGSSFAFSLSDPSSEKWDEDPAGNITRTITEAALFDVSPVTHPAYPSSSVGLRSLQQWREARGVVHHRAEGPGLLISIDYDRTFSAAPGLWRSFIEDATNRGNRVICVTRREPSDENRETLRTAFAGVDVSEVILCGAQQQKRQAAEASGLQVDIWIDDSPETIPAAEATRAIEIKTPVAARAKAAAQIARLMAYVNG